MDLTRQPRRRWSLTPAAFEALLRRLSDNREQAALEFEEHRRYLITLFTYAGAGDAEHLADTTLDRAAKRLTDGEEISNMRAWLRGAARMVLLEAQTQLRRESTAAAEALVLVDDFRTGAETLHRLLEECLALLSAENRLLIESYYRSAGESLLETRRRLSGQLGLSSENLRTRALRIRNTLEECFRKRRTPAECAAGEE